MERDDVLAELHLDAAQRELDAAVHVVAPRDRVDRLPQPCRRRPDRHLALERREERLHLLLVEQLHEVEVEHAIDEAARVEREVEERVVRHAVGERLLGEPVMGEEEEDRQAGDAHGATPGKQGRDPTESLGRAVQRGARASAGWKKTQGPSTRACRRSLAGSAPRTSAVGREEIEKEPQGANTKPLCRKGNRACLEPDPIERPASATVGFSPPRTKDVPGRSGCCGGARLAAQLVGSARLAADGEERRDAGRSTRPIGSTAQRFRFVGAK